MRIIRPGNGKNRTKKKIQAIMKIRAMIMIVARIPLDDPA